MIIFDRMKKCTLLFIFFVTVNISFAQNWLWADTPGGIYNNSGGDVSTDASGNVYMTGVFSSPTITFGTYTLTNASPGYSDIFLVKYDSSGNVIWAKRFGGTNDDYGKSVAIDVYGNIYLVGAFYSTSITFGTYPITKSGTGYNLFLTKYDSAGVVLWAKGAGGVTSNIYPDKIATDPSGNICATGFFSNASMTIGTYTLTNAGYDDIFLAKFDSSGTVLWATCVGDTGYEQSHGVATDAFGNIYITGFFQTPSLTFGTYTINNVNTSSIIPDNFFLVKYSPTGAVL